MRPDSREEHRQGEGGPRELGARGAWARDSGAWGLHVPVETLQRWRKGQDQRRPTPGREGTRDPGGWSARSPKALERGNHTGRQRGGAGGGVVVAGGAVRVRPGRAQDGQRGALSVRDKRRELDTRTPGAGVWPRPGLRGASAPRSCHRPSARPALDPSLRPASCPAPSLGGCRAVLPAHTEPGGDREAERAALGPSAEAEPGPGARACLRLQETAGESREATGPVPPGFSPGTRGQPGGRSRGPANSEAGTPRRQLEVGTLRAAASPGATERRPTPAPVNSGSGTVRGSSAPTPKPAEERDGGDRGSRYTCGQGVERARHGHSARPAGVFPEGGHQGAKGGTFSTAMTWGRGGRGGRGTHPSGGGGVSPPWGSWEEGVLGEVDRASVTRSFTPSLGREWGFPAWASLSHSLTQQASIDCLLCARRWGSQTNPSPVAAASDR